MAELQGLQAEGHFPAGSMGPKVDAALRFLEGGGERVIIAHLEEAMSALRGDSGTHIVAGDE
jgi:carbamate kinase